MAVTETSSQSSQKSKHKKDYGVNSVNSPSKNSYHRPGNVSEEEDDSETDLDRPLFKKPVQVNRNLPQPPKKSVQVDNSDSDSDVDDPPKRSSAVKPAATQEPSDDSESEEEPQSISLMQYNNSGMLSHRKSPQLKDAAKHPKVNRTPKAPEMSTSESESAEEPDVDENAHKPKQQQQKIQQQSSSDSEEETESNKNPPRQELQQETSITNRQPSSSDSSSFEEETESNENPPQQQLQQQTSITSKQPSSSDSEEESEINETPLPHKQIQQTQQQQPQQQLSDSENESETGTRMNPELNRSVRIKQEILTPDDPNMEEEEEEDAGTEDTNDDDGEEDEENERSNPWSESSGWERSRTDLGVNSTQSLSIPTASQQAQQALLFQQQHTPVSAPVVEIAPDSRVWLMQVPRSIPAAELHGRHLPVNPKGGETLNLPSGRWQILKQEFHDSANPLPCILSSGHLIYGIRWLEPESYWFLKRVPNPLQMETKTLTIRKEIHPIPIKKLLKMKTNPAIRKFKRTRDSSPDEYGDSSVNPQKRRKKLGDHSITESSMENQKKRKRTELVDEETPTRKRKKTKVSESEDTYGEAADNCLCDRSDKKKKKHKEKSEESQFILNSVDLALKKELLSSQESESSRGKRHKRKKQEVHTPSEDSQYQNQISGNEESFETHKKKKKKKSKENSDQEMLQSPNMKTYEEAPSVAEDVVEKKEKKKHKHRNERESEGEMLEEIKIKQKPQVEEEQEGSTKKNKKKHKHKDRDHPKVKQEKDFWERETSPNFLKRLYLTQALPEDK